MTKQSFLFYIFLFITLVACGSQEEDNNVKNLYKYNQELPLSVGNFWTYKVSRYDGFNSDDKMTATSTLTDTVTYSEANQDLWVAKIHSVYSAEVLIEVHGNYPAVDMLEPAYTINYWFIVDGNHVLRQQNSLNLADLQSQVIVEFAFPISLGSKWSLYNAKDAPLNNEVKNIGSITVPAGHFANCFYLEGTMGGTTYDDWFCPGIGIVWRNVVHLGTPFGYKQELMSYKVK